MEKKSYNTQKPPHCLILPFPIQGHINPMLQFSKRLAHKGITITLAATKHLSKTPQNFPNSISVETISDGFDEEGRGDTGTAEYVAEFQRVGSRTLTELLTNLKSLGRAVDCIIYDTFLPWGLGVAKELGIIGAAFFTQSCAVNIIYYHVYKGKLTMPLLEKEYLFPGLPVLEPWEFPSFIYDRQQHPGSFELVLSQLQDVEEADFVFVNSIYELEKEVTDWMSKFWQVKTIGPTIPSMYLDKKLLDDKDYGLSIFKPVDECINWLDKKPPKSVIYVSFGSMAELQSEQMEELSQALKSTKNYFIWIVRSSEHSKLPNTFVQETSEKGLTVPWCSQLEVLAHDSIGCFVTHCGWNSTLEALSLGVPMVAMPWWSDQSVNSKFVMNVWKMGIRARSDVNNIVRKEEIVRCVKDVMEGGGGEEIRRNARKWRDLSREAVEKGGSSDTNIDEFVNVLNLRSLEF